jgi:hypothetical protein
LSSYSATTGEYVQVNLTVNNLGLNTEGLEVVFAGLFDQAGRYYSYQMGNSTCGDYGATEGTQTLSPDNIIYSRKGVAHDSRWVSQQYERLIDESARLLDRAKAGSINQSDLDAYWTIREELHVGIDKIQKDIIFLLGIVSLLVNAAQASSIQQPQNSYSQTTTLGKLSH